MTNPGGKGSKRRPQLVPDEVVAENWRRIFGKKKRKAEKDDEWEEVKRQRPDLWADGTEWKNE